MKNQYASIVTVCLLVTIVCWFSTSVALWSVIAKAESYKADLEQCQLNNRELVKGYIR